MAAITLVQSRTTTTGGATSLPLAFSSAVTPGNMLMCSVESGNLSPSVSDGVNGSWGANIVQSTHSVFCGLFIFPNTAAGTPTVTVSIGVSSSIQMTIMEWSGISLASPVDQTAHANSPPTAASNTVGPTASTSQPIELVVMATSLNASGTPWSAGSGFTLVGTPTSANGVQYLVTSTTGAQSGTINWTGTHSWDSVIATFLPQAAQPLPIYTRRYVHYYI